MEQQSQEPQPPKTLRELARSRGLKVPQLLRLAAADETLKALVESIRAPKRTALSAKLKEQREALGKHVAAMFYGEIREAEADIKRTRRALQRSGVRGLR